MSLSELLLSHRSIRSYKPDPIPQELIDEVLSAAVAGASSSGNLNSVSMILTRDEDRRRKLYELHSQQDMVLQAPLVITFCADWHRTRAWLKARNARDNFNNFVGYLVASADAMILAQNVCLGFEAKGLGICYMGTTLFSLEGISELLELPETVVPVTTIVVGYPNESPGKRDRLPMEGLVFDERYAPLEPDQIDAVYAEREIRGWARYMANPELKAMAEEHGITSLAQFYTSKIKYDPDYFIPRSQEILEFLRAKGFLD
jgi:nitroreductase